MHRNIGQKFVSVIMEQIAGLRYGFTTKSDGDMHVEPVRKRFLKSVFGDQISEQSVKQVHGNGIFIIGKSLEAKRNFSDAIVYAPEAGKKNSQVLMAFGADCTISLLVEPEAGVIAAMHAGWRGLLAGIVNRTIEAMEEMGARRSEIRVVIGAHIRSCCYEVDLARAFKFRSFFGEGSVITHGDKKYLNMSYCLQSRLIELGIKENYIDEVSHCTRDCNYDYFSFRREGDSVGRQIAYIHYEHN